MSDSIEKLRDYRDRMEGPMEALAHAFDDLGISPNRKLDDDEFVAVAAAKLRQMHKMLLAAGMTEAMLNAVMAG